MLCEMKQNKQTKKPNLKKWWFLKAFEGKSVDESKDVGWKNSNVGHTTIDSDLSKDMYSVLISSLYKKYYLLIILNMNSPFKIASAWPVEFYLWQGFLNFLSKMTRISKQVTITFLS